MEDIWHSIATMTKEEAGGIGRRESRERNKEKKKEIGGGGGGRDRLR